MYKAGSHSKIVDSKTMKLLSDDVITLLRVLQI